jgi:hypothetical protein
MGSNYLRGRGEGASNGEEVEGGGFGGEVGGGKHSSSVKRDGGGGVAAAVGVVLATAPEGEQTVVGRDGEATSRKNGDQRHDRVDPTASASARSAKQHPSTF